MDESKDGPVLCFGEVLWDSMPQGLFPGGAPVNVAYHLHRLGVEAIPISAVGADVLGEELLRRLKHWRLATDFVATIAGKPTGFVRVTDEGKGPVYEIVKDVAWDYIQVNQATLDLAARAKAIVFGSLAQRSEHNRSGLEQIIRAQAPDALIVLDVNLRPPFDDRKVLWDFAAGVGMLKLNHDELSQLLGKDIKVNDLESAARELSTLAACGIVCVTAGAHGAGLLLEGDWHWEPARQIKVADTVGAGDAFLAALISGICRGEVCPRELLQRACRLAEFVASRPGATPPYEINASGEILEKL